MIFFLWGGGGGGGGGGKFVGVHMPPSDLPIILQVKT